MVRSNYRKIGCIILSNLFYALCFVLFFLDNQIAAGGFGGIATAVTTFVPINPGLFTFILTAPFLVWGGFQRGWFFTLETVISSALFSIFTDALLWLPALTNDKMLAAVFGGVLYSIGTLFMLLGGVSAGGTDLVAQLIRYHFPHITHGTLLFIFNSICIAIAVVVFGNFESALYAIIAIFTSSICADKLSTGPNKAYISYVITRTDAERIAQEIGTRLHRGVTLQKGVGMYLKNEQNILMTVIKPAEVYRLKDLVCEIDPTAFVTFSLANGVFGGGFQDPKGQYPKNIKCSADIGNAK